MNQLKVKRIDERATLPTYATAGAGCFDLACIDGGVVIPGGYAIFRTGLAFEVPENYVMEIDGCSGHGFSAGVRLVNGSGQIDSSNRGEVRVGLHNDRKRLLRIDPGDRIAQAKLVHAPRATIVEVDELSETARGEGGFGSTRGAELTLRSKCQTCGKTYGSHYNNDCDRSQSGRKFVQA